MTAPLSWDELEWEVAPAPSWDDLEAEVAAAKPAHRPGLLGLHVSDRDRDVARQVGRGLARSGYRTAIGITDLLGFDDTADQLRQSRDQAEGYYGDAQTTAGKVASGAAGLVGDMAQFAAPGALLSRVAAIPAIARAVPAAGKLLKPTTVLGRVGRDVALNAPLNLATGIQQEESAAQNFGDLLDSDRLRAVASSTPARLGFEVALDAGLGGALEGAGHLVAQRGARRAALGRVNAARDAVLDAERGQLDVLRSQTADIAPKLDALSDAEAAVRQRRAVEAPLEEAQDAAFARRDAAREAAAQRQRETLDLAQAHDQELRRAASLSGEADELRYPITKSVREALGRFHTDVGEAARRVAPEPPSLTDRVRETAREVDDRRARMASYEPPPRTSTERRAVSRDEFGPFDTPEARTATRDRAADYLWSLRGERFTNSATGLQAEIRKSAITKARHHSATPEKVSALRILPELIEDAQPVALDVPPRSSKLGAKRKRHIKAYHYFTADAVIDGDPISYRLVLTEEVPRRGDQSRRVFYWDLDVNDPTKGARAPEAGPLGGPTSLDVDPARRPGRPTTSRPTGTLPPGAADVNQALLAEARKYPTAQEFIRRVRGSATQHGDYTPGIRVGGTGPDSRRLSDLGIDPDQEVVIYRGVPDPSAHGIVDGDFVTTDPQAAADYAGGPENVVSRKVTAKDLIHEEADAFDADDPFGPGAEFIYSDSRHPIRELTDDDLAAIHAQAAGSGVDDHRPYPDHGTITETRAGGRLAWAGGDTKFRRVGTEELEGMHRRLVREMEGLTTEEQKGINAWLREDGHGAMHSGVARSYESGRAKAGANQVWRQLQRVEAELAGRYNALSPDDLAARPTFAFGEDGEPLTFRRSQSADPFATGHAVDDEDMLFGGIPTTWGSAARAGAIDNLVGGAIGATAGGLADPEHPGQGMAAGFVAGAAGQAGLRALLDRAGAAGQLVRRPERIAPSRVELPPNRWRPPAAPAPAPRPSPSAVDPASVNPDEFFNFRRAILDPGGERALRAEVQRVAATEGLAPKTRETHPTVIARALGIDPSDIAPGATDRLGRDKLLAIRNRIVTNADAIAEGHVKLASGGLIVTEREVVERGIKALEAQQHTLLSQFIRQRSETGRDLAALRILAQRTHDPVVWLSRAAETAGRPLTGSEQLRIRQLANEGKTATLAQEVASLRTATVSEKGTTLLKAMMLTSPKTHLANLVGNTTMAMLETAKDAPAMLVDRMLGRLAQVVSRGQLAPTATKDFSAAQVRASVAGAQRGLEEAKAVMRGAPIEGALQKYDFSRETNFDNAILDGFTKGVFRSLQAADRVFYGAALQRSLAEQAALVAKREGLRGDALARRIADLSDLRTGARDVTDDMVMQAIADAELATFTNRGLLSDLGSRAKGVLADRGGPIGQVAGDVLMPFVRTPANVVARTIEYSPLGALGTIPDVMRLVEAAAKGEPALAAQRRIADRLGRSALGTSTAIVAGAMLAAHDRMTGTYPTDSRTRQQWAQEGKIPNAVKLGDRWYSLERISPLGNLMAIGASLVTHLRDNLHPDDEGRDPLSPGRAGSLAGVQAVGDIGKYAMEQSFLTGVNRSLDAIRDPERGAMSFVEGLGSMAVPSVVGAVARSVDPVQRETEGVVDAIRARIPGLSHTLPAKVDAFGKPITRDGGLSPLVDFTGSRRDRTADDWVVGELARVGATIGRRQRAGDESPRDYERRLRLEGPELRAVVESVILSPDYQQLPAQLDAAAEYDNAFRAEYPVGAARDRLVREMQRDMIDTAVRASRGAFSRAKLGRPTYAEAAP